MCEGLEWLRAISTFLAVVAALFIAIFQDRMRNWFVHPEIGIYFTMNPPDCQQTSISLIQYLPAKPSYSSQNQGGVSLLSAIMMPAYYFRLKISNSGKKRAESVEVYAESLSRIKVDGTPEPVNSFLPMNLKWTHIGKAVIEGIAPGGPPKFCDLGHIIDPSKRHLIPSQNLASVDSSKSILSLDTEVIPNTLSHLIPPGVYHLRITVGAANAKPKSVTMEINLTGDWYSEEKEMLSQGIGIKVLG